MELEMLIIWHSLLAVQLCKRLWDLIIKHHQLHEHMRLSRVVLRMLFMADALDQTLNIILCHYHHPSLEVRIWWLGGGWQTPTSAL